MPLHVQCAVDSGYRIGFELHPIKSSQSRRESLALVRLGSMGGLMVPAVHCPEHEIDVSKLHALSELNESGETALFVFNRTYKYSACATSRRVRAGDQATQIIDVQAIVDSRAIDLQLSIQTSEVDSQSTLLLHAEQHLCSKCGVCESPYFYSHTNDANRGTQELCHRCHYDTFAHNSVEAFLGNNGANISTAKGLAQPTDLHQQAPSNEEKAL